jgi:protein phosphatase
MNAVCATDIGLVRRENQDAVIVRHLSENAILAVVCDGMGGERSGKKAALIAVKAFVKYVAKRYNAKLSDIEVKKLLLDGLSEANTRVFAAANENINDYGMGTTCVAVLAGEKCLHIVNAGDSRAYMWNSSVVSNTESTEKVAKNPKIQKTPKNPQNAKSKYDTIELEAVSKATSTENAPQERFELITMDHTYVQMLYARGEISQDETFTHPKRNLLTKAVGVEKHIKGDYFTVNLTDLKQQNWILMLCSDGLSGYCEDAEIEDVFARFDSSIDDISRELISMAKRRGGRDNITLALLSNY